MEEEILQLAKNETDEREAWLKLKARNQAGAITMTLVCAMVVIIVAKEYLLGGLGIISAKRLIGVVFSIAFTYLASFSAGEMILLCQKRRIPDTVIFLGLLVYFAKLAIVG